MALKSELILPASNSLEDNAKLWAEHYNNLIEQEHGLFFDFKATPEFEKPALDYLITHFGWTLEKPNFVRKTTTKK